MKTNYTFYDNYNLEELEEEARENLAEMKENDNPSDSEVWDEIYLIDEWNRDDAWAELNGIFNGNYLAIGTCGRWDGTYDGGFVFKTFKELMSRFEDCVYFKIWIENNHFYVKGSHHDGTDMVEVKEITERGLQYYENWNYGSDDRTEREVHRKMFTNSHYTHLIKWEG